MGNRYHKMSRLQRAKQFMPFAALRGFEELLAKVAEHREQKLQLSEDQMEELNSMVQGLSVGDWVRIIYYNGRTYAEVVGPVHMVQEGAQIIGIADKIIGFQDIKEINYYDTSL